MTHRIMKKKHSYLKLLAVMLTPPKFIECNDSLSLHNHYLYLCTVSNVYNFKNA